MRTSGTSKMVLAAVMTATATLGLVSGSAQAADYAECPGDGYMCIWSGNWAGAPSRFFYDNTSWAGSAVGLNNDETWMNDGSQTVRVYNGTSYSGGTTLCMSADAYYSSAASRNNLGESNKWSASVPC